MLEQPELGLIGGGARDHAPRGPDQPRFAGLSALQLTMLTAALVVTGWGMWVTQRLVAPRHDRIVSARLSALVGEYVQAEARSATPPAQVEAEMRAFMRALEREIQRRGAAGQIVLVGEAVLTRNVPDVTDSLRRAVYASGVPRPRVMSAADRPRTPVLAMPRAAAGYPTEAGSPATLTRGNAPFENIPSGSPLVGNLTMIPSRSSDPGARAILAPPQPGDALASAGPSRLGQSDDDGDR